ncbi:sporulation protein SsgA [Kitasatospora sp. NPDC098663]|uniref:sporulation protein SsgA n=1 Tax=Kitasatospora sp. NPDC098663 TaxID=3364096 RepID=UPI0038212EE5
MSEKTTTEHEKHEQRLNSSTTGAVGAWLVHRSKPYLPAWIGTAGVGVAGVAANIAWEGSTAAAVGLTLSSGAVTAASWWAGSGMSKARRIHLAVTTGVASAWLTGAALAGPMAGPLPDLYLMGGPVVALSWNVRQLTRGNDKQDGGERDASLLEKVGLAKAKLGKAMVEPNRVTVPIALPAGELTNQDVAKAMPLIASALDVPGSAIRFQPDPDSARRGVFVIVPTDMLKDPTRWPGPSAPGDSIAAPLRIGVYDDGSALLLPLLDAIHILIMGMTGSGKTEGGLDVLLEVLTRCDVTVWLSDAAKAGQDFMPLAPAIDWCAFDMPSTMAMVAAVQAAIPARTRWLRDHGYRAWEPAAAQRQTSKAHSCKKLKACGCEGLPYLLAWIEEAAKPLREMGEDAFTGVAQEARSAGVSLVLSMQRASGYQLSTDTRASLPAALCFGVRGDDAQFALPEEVLDAGANPAAWGNKRKGYVYAVSAGIDEDMHANPARTYWTGSAADYVELAEWAVGTFAAVRRPTDPITAAAAEQAVGGYFTDRRARAGLDSDQQTETSVYLSDQTPADDDQDAGIPVDPEDEGIDPTAEIPPVGDPIALPPLKLGPEDAREMLLTIVETLASIAPGTVAVKDLAPYLGQITRDRSWVSKEMKKLSEEGRLAPTGTDGVYRLVPVLAGS